jgi:RimJ/RimL family protein N-acetyltransferase
MPALTESDMRMETRRILLREVRTDDLTTLFTWRNTDKFRFLFHHNENSIDYVGFCEEFAYDATARRFQYVVEKKDSQKLIGLTFVHRFPDEEECCFLNIFLEEHSEGRGHGVDVFVLFCQFLFQSVGIKKVYVGAFAYNTSSLACLRASGMTEEERQIGKHLHQGKYYDIFRFFGDSTLLPKINRMLQRLS